MISLILTLNQYWTKQGDGNLLIKNDPFSGVKVNREGYLEMPKLNGLGLTLNSNCKNMLI